MKLFSKRTSFVILILAVVCLISRYVLCYWCGYYQKSFAPIGLQELLAFFGLVLIFASFVTWIVSLIQRQQRIWTTTLLAALFVLWGLKYILPWPHDLILYGLRDGMLRNYGLANMRQFARDIHETPTPTNLPPVFGKIFMHQEDLNPLKMHMGGKYPFVAQCEAVGEFNDIVQIDWGGFENHWGVSIAVDGKRIDPQHLEPGHRIIRASDDIYFTSDY